MATLKRSETVALPERHLGLVQAEEVRDELELRFSAGADWLEEAGFLAAITQLLPVSFTAAPVPAIEPSLQGVTIGIARDAAFSFIYDANLRLLDKLGAQVTFFSPLHDAILPEVDALWLPGGYPELHAATLAENTGLHRQIQRFYQTGKPILAECGGFLYSLQTLTDLDERQHAMLGLLDGHGAMRGKRGCQGMQTAVLPEGDIRAHAHHRSRSGDTPEPLAHGRRQHHPAPGEAIFRVGGLTASYLHLFFPSNPDAVAQIFGAAKENFTLND